MSLATVRCHLIMRRVALGLSQRDLAALMNTAQNRISDLENGGSDSRISTLDRWATALGMRLVLSVEPAGEQ